MDNKKQEDEWLKFDEWCEMDPPQTAEDEWRTIEDRLTKKYGPPSQHCGVEAEARVREDERRKLLDKPFNKITEEQWEQAKDWLFAEWKNKTHAKVVVMELMHGVKAVLELKQQLATAHARIEELFGINHILAMRLLQSELVLDDTEQAAIDAAMQEEDR